MDSSIENRDTFFARLEPSLTPSELYDVKLAYILAKFGHRAQLRKEVVDGELVRYFEHPRRVALILIDEMKIIDRDALIAALLHDAFEDTRDITPELAEHTFGRDPTMIVKVLSKTPKEGYMDRFMRCVDWRPFAIKICDRLDNLRHISQTTPEFQLRQANDTVGNYGALFFRALELAPEVHKAKIKEKIDEISQITFGILRK